MKFFFTLILFFSANLFAQSDSVLVVTDTTFVDSLKQEKIVDTLIPLNNRPLFESSFIISNKEIMRNDYRFTGNLFSQFPSSILHDFGIAGQNSQLQFFSQKLSNVSYLENGVELLKGSDNTFNLNQYQSEIIDSIEIVPLTRGFLFGNFNNAVTLNFITKDVISYAPVSRVKYFEGLFGEAMLDAQFNSITSDRFNLFFGATNRKSEERFDNSSYSIWNVTTGLKYFLSNKINLSLRYSHNKSNIDLFGGINIDSLSKLYANPEEAFYDIFGTIVNSEEAYQKNTKHNFTFSMLGKFIPNSLTKLDLFYNYSLDENRNLSSFFRNYNNQKKRLGLLLTQDYSISIFDFKFLSGLTNTSEKLQIIDSNTEAFKDVNSFFATTIFSMRNFNNRLTTSLFAKTLHNNNEISNGVGADLHLKLIDEFSIYLGASKFRSHSTNERRDDDSDNKILEAGMNFKNDFILLNLNYFSTTYDYAFSEKYRLDDRFINRMKSASGLGVKLNINYWKLFLETNSAYFNQNYFEEIESSFPIFRSDIGFYYKNIHFESSLDLKAGINTKLFLSEKIELQFGEKFNYQLDIFISGVIQQRATVFLTWENILDRKYYLIAPYPMYPRGVRFGITWVLFN